MKTESKGLKMDNVGFVVKENDAAMEFYTIKEETTDWLRRGVLVTG